MTSEQREGPGVIGRGGQWQWLLQEVSWKQEVTK